MKQIVCIRLHSEVFKNFELHSYAVNSFSTHFCEHISEFPYHRIPINYDYSEWNEAR